MTLKGQSQGHSDFKALYLVKGRELGPMLVLTYNRNAYMASLMALSNLTLTDLEGQSQGHSDFQYWDICMEKNLPAVILRPFGCHKKGFVGGRGFPLSQRS